MRRNARVDAQERVRSCGHFAALLRFAALAPSRLLRGIPFSVPLRSSVPKQSSSPFCRACRLAGASARTLITE